MAKLLLALALCASLAVAYGVDDNTRMARRLAQTRSPPPPPRGTTPTPTPNPPPVTPRPPPPALGSCASSATCAGLTPICTGGRCAACTGNAQCITKSASTPYCLATGACSATCTASTQCSNSATAPICSGSGSCTACSSDAQCSAKNAATPYCQGNGSCAATPPCPAGQSLCGGVCKDINNDPTNCGSCSNSCNLSSEGCSAGVCTALVGINLSSLGANCGTAQTNRNLTVCTYSGSTQTNCLGANQYCVSYSTSAKSCNTCTSRKMCLTSAEIASLSVGGNACF